MKTLIGQLIKFKLKTRPRVFVSGDAFFNDLDNAPFLIAAQLTNVQFQIVFVILAKLFVCHIDLDRSLNRFWSGDGWFRRLRWLPPARVFDGIWAFNK